MIVIVDTNIYFSALYNPEGNEAEIIRRANSEELILLSPNTVRDELERVLETKLDWNEEKTTSVTRTLPTVWVPKEKYEEKLALAKSLIPHEKDSPILACALKFETGTLTGNTTHFDKPEIRKKATVWSSRKLLNYLESEKDPDIGKKKYEG